MSIFHSLLECNINNLTLALDGWSAYQHLGEQGYNHLVVNHSLTFVDMQTGAHTNKIERLWRCAKDRGVPK